MPKQKEKKTTDEVVGTFQALYKSAEDLSKELKRLREVEARAQEALAKLEQELGTMSSVLGLAACSYNSIAYKRIEEQRTRSRLEHNALSHILGEAYKYDNKGGLA